MRRLTILVSIISFIGQFSCQTKSDHTKTDHTKTEIERLKEGQLPKEISISGNTVSVQKWADNLGINYFILSSTDEFIPKKAMEARGDYIIRDGDTIYSGVKDYRDKEIYMTHVVISDKKIKTVWRREASVRDCAVDLELAFLEEYPRITDLDKDGTFEIWTTYHSGCHGDVSPTEIVIMMNTEAKQDSLIGLRIANIGLNREVGGKIYSNSFMRLSDPYKIYADSIWNKFKRWN